jgi:hypothetical protein
MGLIADTNSLLSNYEMLIEKYETHLKKSRAPIVANENNTMFTLGYLELLLANLPPLLTLRVEWHKPCTMNIPFKNI